MDFHLRWSGLSAPQRPVDSVVEAMRPLIAERVGPVLQLGVTPEIARLSAQGIAVDVNPEMVSSVWPGDSATHHAIVGDWLELPLEDASIDSAFGDGSLTMIRWPQDYRLLFENLTRVLRPGGRLVLRCFVRPDECEGLDELAGATLAGEVGHAGAFKLRFNMAVAAVAGEVSVTGSRIHDLFEEYFPDRIALARATGWSAADFAQIDAYAGATSLHSYPTRAEIVSTLPAEVRHSFVETSGYLLAERCPLLVVDFPAA
jgi:SAM-dependent methyltransferase